MPETTNESEKSESQKKKLALKKFPAASAVEIPCD